tara:strand:- start:654 stop:794 length:141 start_codon:yes stop_codon:yes gene_type:complete
MGNIKIGDIVEKIIDTTIPQRLIDRIQKNGCNCEKNKQWLNDLTKD